MAPTASLIVVTPICPHTLNSRSVILSSKDHIAIEVCAGKGRNQAESTVVFDGDGSYDLMAGDRVEITKAKECTNIIKINKISFLEILRKKLGEH